MDNSTLGVGEDGGGGGAGRQRATPLDVELTGYVLRALMLRGARDDVVRGGRVVRWLTMQRNAYGGFQSTQVSEAPSRGGARGQGSPLPQGWSQGSPFPPR